MVSEEFLILNFMPIITLTSDWGLRDYFLAVVRGKIMSRLPEATIVDISHEISPFNLMQASFIVRNAYPHFPAGTVHILFLLHEETEQTPHLAARYGDQYFIGADNGIFSLIFDRMPDEIVRLTDGNEPGKLVVPARDRFVDAAVKLASGRGIGQLGEPVSGWNEQLHFQPVVSGDVIRGVVIYLNRYENAVTNITRELFDKVSQGRRFIIEFRGETIHHINAAYSNVPVGEITAIFGSTGHLEIAINRGNAGSLLGLEVNDPVRVEFHG